jgi:hypothetical protein
LFKQIVKYELGLCLLMRLLNLFNWTDSYSNAKKMYSHAVSTKRDYTFDANVIIEFADHGDDEILQEIGKDPKFEIAQITFNELWGLSHAKSSDLKNSVKARTIRFLKLIPESKIVDQGPNSPQMAKLRNLSILLPRKVVHDAMFRMKGSWIEKILQLFSELQIQFDEAKTSRQRVDVANHRDQVVKVYFSEYYIMENYVTALYAERIEMLERKYKVTVPAEVFKEDIYLEFCKKAVKDSRKKALSIARSYLSRGLSKVNLKKMHSELKNLAFKTYSADLKFVAYTLENARKGYSLDSDVIWMYELDHHF